MPRLIPFRLVAACALAFVLVLSTAVAAAAKGTPVDLRVVGGGSKILAEEALGASTTSIKTSPKALCFGKGTGGSGKSVTIEGSTALGVLGQAAKTTAALRPLLITDHFVSEFGLGLCGIGKSSSTSKLSWYLKVNHKNPNRSGETVKLHAGDEVLWALEPFPYPKELALIAPEAAEAGKPFTVSVFAYDDKGKKKPAAGVTVTGASAPTDAEGHATVVLSAPGVLAATHGKDIPSNQVAVCLGGVCPGG
ncbi:MAG TPA: hypothetical protein VKC63_03020 [Solirubrobacterales bacterium]|nr:hypothetical protein [Solirubrobacterales bacterium]